MLSKFWLHGSLLWSRKLALALSKKLQENISAFVSRIRKWSDRVHIEYLHINMFQITLQNIRENARIR